MIDELKNELLNAPTEDAVELTDELLDAIAGGYIYHDAGDPGSHRREAYYVLDNSGDIIMRVDDMNKATRWAGNLRQDQNLINTAQFEKLRAGKRI